MSEHLQQRVPGLHLTSLQLRAIPPIKSTKDNTIKSFQEPCPNGLFNFMFTDCDLTRKFAVLCLVTKTGIRRQGHNTNRIYNPCGSRILTLGMGRAGGLGWELLISTWPLYTNQQKYRSSQHSKDRFGSTATLSRGTEWPKVNKRNTGQSPRKSRNVFTKRMWNALCTYSMYRGGLSEAH